MTYKSFSTVLLVAPGGCPLRGTEPVISDKAGSTVLFAGEVLFFCQSLPLPIIRKEYFGF